MCENTNDFSDVKVGDKLWSVQLGECEVIENEVRGGYRYIGMSNGVEKCHYGWDGRVQKHHASPPLFWSRPEIIAPPKPKRKVVKTVEAWANVYSDGSVSYFSTPHDAKNYARPGKTANCIRVAGTYEVFE